MTIRVLVADDQAVARSGLRVIFNAEPDLEVVGEALDGLDAVRLARELRPDVVVMDIRMPRMDGLQATRRVRDLDDPPEVVVLTTFGLDDYVLGALRGGAAGFVLKDSDPELLVSAVRAAAAGDALLAPEVTRHLIGRFTAAQPRRAGDPALAELTPREREMLLAIARGLSNAAIAAELVVEESTVKSHVRRMMLKLGIASRVQAVIYAYETGLVSAGGDAEP